MTLFEHRESYPDAPGYRRTDTSRAAAAAVESAASRLQAQVLAAISAAGEAGMTTNEIAAQIGVDKGSVQPRTSELRAIGSIKDSGQRRSNDSGRRAIVWSAA